ncbi:MAG: FTR1 family protein [Nitrospinales bacterium]
MPNQSRTLFHKLLFLSYLAVVFFGLVFFPAAGYADEAPALEEEIGDGALFIQSFSIIVREGFEAILIIAALIAFLIQSENRNRLKTIYLGAGIGIAGSLLTAYLSHGILNISDANQKSMEGITMLVAAAILFFTSYWLISKVEAQKWQKYIAEKVRQAVSTGSAFALGAVAFLSVYREGFETVLFYQALYAYAGNGAQGIVSGFLAGCFCLAIIYYLINVVGLRIPVRWFFAVTGVFLYYMAFTFMGRGLHELQEAGILALTPHTVLPRISWLGIYPTWETFAGQALLVAAYAFALLYTFGNRAKETK